MFINDYLLAYCQLARVRELVGYYRHDAPPAELEKLNPIWDLSRTY